MDHFGGFNTFLSAFAYGGTAICLNDRTPATVCRTIEASAAELLPATPTFLRLLALSGAWQHHDLSSIRLVTYGAEPMPQSTLTRARAIFAKARFKQTYGLSELGVLHSQSPDEGSIWIKVGGAGFETKVVAGVLWVRSGSSMVGYLNAPSPFDAEGWMNTGDEVDERNGMIRFLGRKSEIINVGGQKVFPSEIEDVLLAADNVCDASVYALAHPLLGQVPGARVALVVPESTEHVAARLRRHCRERLSKYKVPMRFFVEGDMGMNKRLKKRR
jgi:acyl-CoA synthetase (AMP-forming)/AMP-acid ligase II